jgi:hypothetical protein
MLSSAVGMVARDEGVGGVHHRHALEVDVRARELRADVVHVVGMRRRMVSVTASVE